MKTKFRIAGQAYHQNLLPVNMRAVSIWMLPDNSPSLGYDD